MTFENLKPFGISLITILALGGTKALQDMGKNLATISSVRAQSDFKTWIETVNSAEAALVQINWKKTAPQIFCNEFAIGYNPRTRKCSSR